MQINNHRNQGGLIGDRYIKFKLVFLMCYEQGKIRIIKMKAVQNNAPLIKEKKHFGDGREKENEKYNPDYNTKPRTYYNNEFITTAEFENNKFTNAYVNIPYNHNLVPKERYGCYPNQPNNFIQTTKTLTFANVKNNTNKPKDTSTLQEQPSMMAGQEHKKAGTMQAVKNNVLLDKQKYVNLTQRNEKVITEKVPQKKDNNIAKAVHSNKPTVNTTNNTSQISQIDDFSCNEELEFKPVEKKSLIPQKKYTAEKTTSKFDFAKPKKAEKKNELKDLKQFQNLQKIANTANDGDALNFLCLKQEEYSVDPGYIQKNHKTLIWWSRAILVDWMRHICYQFGLQRDTYHIAVVLLDNYLAKITNVPKSILQAIGATTLFIASKLEEFQCKQSKEFAKSTNNSCSVQDIHQFQIKIVKTLKFRLNPPTLFNLSNKMMSQWDIFISSNEFGKNHSLLAGKQKVFFKQLDENSYRMFREMMQLIDCSVIDIQTAQYKPKMLICSFLYLLIGRQMGIFKNKEVVQQFPCSSLYLLDENNEFNNLFRSFVEHVFGFSLFEILPTVQYCATYFDLSFTYEKPMISEQEDLESMSLEEYCSYQTYNSTMIKTVKSRYRGIYRGIY